MLVAQSFMNMKLIYILSIIFLTSCIQKNHEKDKITLKDISKNNDSVTSPRPLSLRDAPHQKKINEINRYEQLENLPTFNLPFIIDSQSSVTLENYATLDTTFAKKYCHMTIIFSQYT